MNTTTLQQLSDEEIVLEILEGNVPFFELLIRRLNPVLYKTGRGYGFNHQDTEDLMQEAFISCFQSISKFQNRSSFKTWIVRIMLNLCYHKVHDKKQINERNHQSLFFNSEPMGIKPQKTDPLINKELNNVIEKSLQKLPDDYRISFTLRELTGLSVAETAELLHITATNVKVRVNRAKAMLRKEIEKTYAPEEIYEFNLVYCDKIVNAVMAKILP